MLNVETWIEALESGRYQQSSRHLRRGDGFCCLGVACDLSGVGTWEAYDYYHFESERHDTRLPDVVQAELGLASAFGDFRFAGLSNRLREEILAHIRAPEEDLTSLAALNDAGVPFAVIAKVIRARPKGLFLEAAP